MGGGSLRNLPEIEKATRPSPITSRILAMTEPAFSPGKIRQFNIAVASRGSTLSLTPDSIMVTAVVVRSEAAPLGVRSSRLRTRRLLSGIAAIASRAAGDMRQATD